MLSRFTIAVWDEFQELVHLKQSGVKADWMAHLRSVWQRHQRTAYVISGSAPSMLRELVSSEHSPFFQHFDVMELLPMGREDAIELLFNGSEGAIDDALATRIYAILGGHPFYLQMVGQALMRLSPPTDEYALKEALGELLFSSTGRLSLYFDREYHQVVGRAATLSATLGAIAIHGSTGARIVDISERIQVASGSTVRYIERLGEQVERLDNGRYRVTNPTFGLWLQWRQPGGTVVPMTVIGDEAEQAVARHLALLGFELVCQSRASRGAFDLLAIRGNTQLGLQVERSPTPLRFCQAPGPECSPRANDWAGNGWWLACARMAP